MAGVEMENRRQYAADAAAVLSDYPFVEKIYFFGSSTNPNLLQSEADIDLGVAVRDKVTKVDNPDTLEGCRTVLERALTEQGFDVGQGQMEIHLTLFLGSELEGEHSSISLEAKVTNGSLLYKAEE